MEVLSCCEGTVIRIEVCEATTIVREGIVLVVVGNSNEAALSDFEKAAEDSTNAFQRLGALTVHRGFEVPDFACIVVDGGDRRAFLRGDLKLQVVGEEGGEIRLDGSASSTWVESALPSNGVVTLTGGTGNVGSFDDQPQVASAGDRGERIDENDSSAEIAPAPKAAPFPGHRAPPMVAVRPQSRDIPQNRDIPPVPKFVTSESTAGPAAPPTAAAGASGAAAADPADATVDAAQLASDPSVGTQTEPNAAPSPLVTAKVCPCGEANPLAGVSCARCGQSLARDGVSIGQAPRPSLGVVQLDDGETYELTTSIVIGRMPPDDYMIDGWPALPVTVSSPLKHVSKAHIELRLVDWTVNVVDLDSSNGSYVEGDDGRAPRRLRPHVVEQISAGDTVLFGDRSFVLLDRPS